jgi:SAM-dependent methyltransferase
MPENTVRTSNFKLKDSDPLCLGEELAEMYPFDPAVQDWVDDMDRKVKRIIESNGWALPHDAEVYSYSGAQESAGLDGSNVVCEPARKWWVDAVGQEFGTWAEKLPDPRCLEAVYNPEEGYKVNSLLVIGEAMAALMRHHPLAVATRQRAAMQNRVVEQALEQCESGHASIINLGCGTDTSIFRTIAQFQEANPESSKPDIEVDLVDISGTALRRSVELAGGTSAEVKLHQKKLNILDRSSYLEFCKEKEGTANVVAATGFTEYVGGSAELVLGEEGNTTTLEDFISGGFQMLKPGGKLIISQALIDSPLKETLFAGLGWSAFTCREVNEFCASIGNTGIDLDNVEVTITRPRLHAIFTITKPKI